MKLTINDISYIISESIKRLTEGMLLQNLEIPPILYHKSNPAFRKNIAKEGLKPKVGDSYFCHYDGKEGLQPLIFMYDPSAMGHEYDSTYDDDVYIIDTSLLDKSAFNTDLDSGLKGSYTYSKPIPVNAIKLIHKGSGNSLFESNVIGKGIKLNCYEIYPGTTKIDAIMNSINVGSVIISKSYLDEVLSEYEDSVDGFNSNILRVFNDFKPIINIEDFWLNDGFIGRGLSKSVFGEILGQILKISNQIILRAFPDHNKNGLNIEALVKLYQGFGFRILQKTDYDGVIMGYIG